MSFFSIPNILCWGVKGYTYRCFQESTHSIATKFSEGTGWACFCCCCCFFGCWVMFFASQDFCSFVSDPMHTCWKAFFFFACWWTSRNSPPYLLCFKCGSTIFQCWIVKREIWSRFLLSFVEFCFNLLFLFEKNTRKCWNISSLKIKIIKMCCLPQT